MGTYHIRDEFECCDLLANVAKQILSNPKGLSITYAASEKDDRRVHHTKRLNIKEQQILLWHCRPKSNQKRVGTASFFPKQLDNISRSTIQKNICNLPRLNLPVGTLEISKRLYPASAAYLLAHPSNPMHKCQLVHQPFAKSLLGYKKLRQRMFGLNCKAASVRGCHFNSFQISPMIAYSLRDNMAVGARFIYSRTLLKLDNARLKFGDDESGIELAAKDFYTLRHTYTPALIWRQYIPLGRNKRFALFNETSLSAGASQSKFAKDSPVKGTYQTGFEIGVGISPGIVAFATNNMAVEVNVGVMGINYSHVKQVHNQVHEGDLKTSMMNFKVNIFSVGLSMSFYL